MINNDNTYLVDFYKLVYWLTPNRLKNSRLGAYLKSLVIPFALLYQSFRQFRKAKLYELSITPQKCYLQKLLNDRYDFTSRGIYIDDALAQVPFYIYTHDELKPRFIRRSVEAMPHYIYTAGEAGIIKNDFIVFVPRNVVFDMAEMASLLKAYILAGTKFKIQILP